MRSISIVYKRPKKELIQEEMLDTVRIRRSVDEYYTKLQEKAKKKNDEQQNRVTTAKGNRPKSNNKFVASLKIIKLDNKTTPIIHSKGGQEQQGIKKSFSVRKTQHNFFSFKVPSHENFISESPAKDKHNDKGCKLKSLIQLPLLKKKETIVVLSVDFILNEMNFWEQEHIDQYAHRVWRTVQNIASIIWLVRRQSSLKKITSYIKQNNLGQDGVYMVMPKKQGRTLNVSYSLLERELRLEHQKKFIVINGLRSENVSQLHYSMFYSMIPQVRHSQTFIHFLQIDVNDKSRFSNVLKVLSKSLPQPIRLDGIYSDFYAQYTQEAIDKNRQKLEPVSNAFMLERIQVLKKNYSTYFNRVVGLKKMEGEMSIPFIVGDMLKRNFHNLTEFYKLHNHRLQKQNPEQMGLSRLKQKSMVHNKVFYNRPVYLWKF